MFVPQNKAKINETNEQICCEMRQLLEFSQIRYLERVLVVIQVHSSGLFSDFTEYDKVIL